MLQKIQKQSVTFGWVEFWVRPKLYMTQCITMLMGASLTL